MNLKVFPIFVLLLLLNYTSASKSKIPSKISETNSNKAESISQILKMLRNDTNLKIDKIVPEAKQIIKESLERVKQCYDSTIGGSEVVDIFNVTIRQVAKKFFQFHLDIIEDGLITTILKRIKALISSIRFIARRVLKCVLNKDPTFEPTRLGLTPFAAYSHDEFVQTFLLKLESENRTLNKSNHTRTKRSHHGSCNPTVSQLPEEWDWRTYKLSGGRTYSAVTPVKNQGNCGSCYVFAAVAAMESVFMLSNENKEQEQIRFSEQALLNCVPGGCKGGFESQTFEAAKRYGLTREWEQRYRGRKLQCAGHHSIARPTGYCKNSNLNSDKSLQSVVYQYGPSVSGIHANHPDFQYLRGPWKQECTTNSIDHVVLTVGWTKDQFIAKNSWGEHWGVNGYLYIKRDNGNHCGYFNQLSVPFFYFQHKGINGLN